MQAATQTKRKAVESHLADSESIKAGRTGGENVFIVTDSRVLSMTDKEDDGRPVRNIRSTTLTEGVRGVEIQEMGSEEADWGQVAFGALSILTGVLLLALGFDSGGSEAGVEMLLGLFALFGGGYLIKDAFDTPDGEIRVNIETDARTDTYWLPEDEADVAATISEVIGKNGMAV